MAGQLADRPDRSGLFFGELVRLGRAVLLCAGAVALALLALTALMPWQ